MKKGGIIRTYRFNDLFGDVYYVQGENKYDALISAFGREQTRFILKTFKVERVYISKKTDL